MTEQLSGTRPQRTVVASVTLSLDGRSAGPGDDDMLWLVEHAVHEQMGAYFAGIWSGSSTAVMGRRNFEGYRGYWPAVAADPSAPPRDRAFARWLDSVEKVVFSSTIDDPAWSNTRVARDLETEIRALKAAPGRDILVLSSASIIHSLLAAGLVDELRIHLCPELLGSGKRFFDDGLPRSSWRLAGVTTMETGAIGLQYHVQERPMGG
jgi:dihydrofolate reductase